MSEFNPFNATAEEASFSEAVEETGSRRNVIALGALAGVALAAGAFFFLGGSGEEVDEFTPVTRAPRAAPAVSPAPAKKLPVTTNVALGRNPFRALYVQPAAASGGTTTGTAPTTTTRTTTTPVVIVDSGSAPASGGGSTYVPPAQPAPAQPAPAPAAQSTVSLKGVTAGKDGANPTGTFVYDGQKVTGAPGDVMAGKLLVISLQQDNTGGWFANLQLGDGSPFEVHERQTVVVQ